MFVIAVYIYSNPLFTSDDIDRTTPLPTRKGFACPFAQRSLMLLFLGINTIYAILSSHRIIDLRVSILLPISVNYVCIHVVDC